MKRKKIRMAIAEDHQTVIDGLLSLLHKHEYFKAVIITTNPQELLRQLACTPFVFDDAVEFWDRTNREDWAISEQSYRGIRSHGYQPGPYSERERQLWEFDQFVLNRLSDHEITSSHDHQIHE
jgi:hypothetical protein